jgi:hypothetical protein
MRVYQKNFIPDGSQRAELYPSRETAPLVYFADETRENRNGDYETFEFLRKWYEVVIPVQTGIQYFHDFLDSRLRGNDSVGTFFKGLIISLHFVQIAL